MNSGDSGSFNRPRYDRCAYTEALAQSVDPLQYVMYSGKFENCSKCTYDEKNFWRPFDNEIIDTDSELKGIMRKSSKCNSLMYSSDCKKSSGFCTSTFDPSAPIVFAQEVCPIIHSGMPKIDGPGYTLNTEPFCNNRIPRNK